MHGEMMANPRAGLMTLVTQVNKAMNKRASEELLGMRLKQFLTLSYIQDHENVTQQALETALLVDANAVVLLLNDLETAGYVMRRREPPWPKRCLPASPRRSARRCEACCRGCWTACSAPLPNRSEAKGPRRSTPLRRGRSFPSWSA